MTAASERCHQFRHSTHAKFRRDSGFVFIMSMYGFTVGAIEHLQQTRDPSYSFQRAIVTLNILTGFQMVSDMNAVLRKYSTLPYP